MSDTLQFARPGDEARLLEIYQACFPEDDPKFWEWMFKRLYRPENTLVLRKNAQIAASLQMIPCKMRFGDKTFEAHYIYAAATMPEWQGRGLMGELLAQAAEEGLRRGHAFSVLITQEDSLLEYYARFGYEGRFMVGLQPPQKYQSAENLHIRLAVEADIPVLNVLYEQAAQGMLHGDRDDHHWQLQLELFGQGAKVLEIDGQITAYAFADDRGILEAAGPDAGALAAYITPGKAWRTLPLENSHPMGSIKPFAGNAQQLMEQNPCFLNLMFN